MKCYEISPNWFHWFVDTFGRFVKDENSVKSFDTAQFVHKKCRVMISYFCGGVKVLNNMNPFINNKMLNLVVKQRCKYLVNREYTVFFRKRKKEAN